MALLQCPPWGDCLNGMLTGAPPTDAVSDAPGRGQFSDLLEFGGTNLGVRPCFLSVGVSFRVLCADAKPQGVEL